MPDRIKPEPNQVLQFHRNEASDERPLAAKILRVISDTRADLEFYEDGRTMTINDVPLVHPLDAVPGEGPYGKFLPRPDVAAERHLLRPDRTATEGGPQRGESEDSRVLPTVEHVSEDDPLARGQMGLPAEKTESEKSKEREAKKPDPSLKRKR